ncbi:MAG: efflux RND transporter periplasmic adaptor subunit [Deltaproteobacteria bacterium]|nr:efflux RND transporter periplasmic adaptor subunit [Deltaproteobacteria bacterium]
MGIQKKHFMRLLAILPVIVAVMVVMYMVKNRTGPMKKPLTESVRALRVIKVSSVDLVPKAMGYGVAEPGQIWRAVAEVKGTVVFVHPHLHPGALIPEKTVLIEMDPSEYELAVARLQASIEQTRAQIAELVIEKRNTEKSLQIEQRSLALAEKSLERKRKAMKRQALSQDDVDREERNVLLQTQSLQHLKNALSLIPVKRKELRAALAVHQANLKQAGIDLAKTSISTPFDCRISDVNIEKGQFLNAGQFLFEAHGTAVTEVEAQFRAEQLRNLLSGEKRRQFQLGLTMEALRQLFDLNVIIRMQSGDWTAEWTARFERIREAVDPQTRAIKVVAVVDRPYDRVIPGVRPVLARGMFCEMELRAPVRPGSIVLPRSALRESVVFVVDKQNRLRQRQVVVEFAQGDFVVIQSGLSEGETVVVSDPSPAILGMKVAPIIDEALKQHLVTMAEGKEAGR